MNPKSDRAPLSGKLLASRPPRRGRSAVAAALVSLVAHGAIISGVVWVMMAAGQSVTQEVVTMLIPIEEEPPPPPPPPPPAEVTPPPEAPVARGFLTLAPPDVVLPDIPPPQLDVRFDAADFSGVGIQGGRADGDSTIKVTAEDIAAAPRFTPYTVAPELRNRDAVGRALERNYPPLLRDSGIGGRVLVWIFIDEQGRVVRTQVKETSGYEALDAAATKVADLMQFSPALNRDAHVPVWVALPIEFRAN